MNPGSFMKRLFAGAGVVVPDNGTDLSSLAGVGIGLPGVMDERSGGLPSVPALGWPAEDIRPWITR